jgi:uncharacterized protein YjbI with pentapeptide repeats
MIVASMLFAQLAQTAPAPVQPAAPIPIACVNAAGAVDGTGASLPEPVQGATIKSARALAKLRKDAKDGRLLLVEGGDFSNWDFRKLNLAAICFRGTRLAGSNWSGVTAPGMGFIDADLSGADLIGASFPAVLFRTTTLAGANAANADLRGGQLDGGWHASLAGWKLDGARLSGFRFHCGVTEADGCPFDRQGISARGADFSGAVFDGFAFWDAALDGAKVEGTEVQLDNAGILSAAQSATALTIRLGRKRAPVSGRVAALLGKALTEPAASAPMVQAIPGSSGAATRLAAGKYLFVSDRLAIAPQANDPVWMSAMQVLVRIAPSHLMLMVNPDGTAWLRGSASEDGGGQCHVDAGPLRQGAAGSFVATTPPAARSRRKTQPGIPAATVLEDMATIAPEQALAPDGARIVTCTGTANFGKLRRLPADDVTFDSIWSAARPAGRTLP